MQNIEDGSIRFLVKKIHKSVSECSELLEVNPKSKVLVMYIIHITFYVSLTLVVRYIVEKRKRIQIQLESIKQLARSNVDFRVLKLSWDLQPEQKTYYFNNALEVLFLYTKHWFQAAHSHFVLHDITTSYF